MNILQILSGLSCVVSRIQRFIFQPLILSADRHTGVSVASAMGRIIIMRPSFARFKIRDVRVADCLQYAG
jgi:hypothetical protein